MSFREKCPREKGFLGRNVRIPLNRTRVTPIFDMSQVNSKGYNNWRSSLSDHDIFEGLNIPEIGGLCCDKNMQDFHLAQK